MSSVNSDINLNNEFKSQLKKELTSTVFNEIKNVVRTKHFANPEPALRAAETTKLNNQLTKIQNNLKTLSNPQDDKFKYIAAVTPIHLFNPSFQGKARSQAATMKLRYQGLADDCALIIDQLKRNKIALKSYRDSLPRRAGIEKLHAKINIQEEEIENNLEFYTKVQDKLSGSEGKFRGN